MKCSVSWGGEGSMSFDAKTESGHSLRMDGSPEHGGKNSGARPMEMLLVGAGGCSAFDVVLILKKSRQQIKDVRVNLEAQRAEEDPKVFTKINMHFIVEGHNLKESMVKRAIDLSHDKFCSATIMLGKTANITTSYEIKET